MISRRRFIYCAATGLMVPYVRASNPVPLAFWKPASSASSCDAEVADWVSRVVGNGGTVSASTQAAACTYAAALSAASIRTKVLRRNHYAGDQLAACFVPYIKDKGSAIETNENFVGGDYSEAVGLLGDGINKDIITGFTPSTDWSSDNDCGMGVYVRTKTTANDCQMGCADGSRQDYLLVAYGGTTDYTTMHDPAQQPSFADSAGLGHYFVSRTASNSLVMYKNGVSVASTATPGAATRCTNAMFVHAFSGGAQSNRVLAGYEITKGLNATEVLALYNATQAFQTSLGRNV